jgi:hypothetical protein
VAARAIGNWLVVKTLLNIKLLITIQAAILISRHVYPPLLQKRCFLLFRVLLSRGLRYRNLFLFSALSDYEFAIQVDATYLEGWAVSLQYVLIPAVGVYEDTTGTMEDSSVIDQWISAHGTIHLLTSYDFAHVEPCLFKGHGFTHRRSGIAGTKSQANLRSQID